jgi:hypothetical protein
MSWKWQERCLGGGKTNVLEVERAMSKRRQDRCLGGGKRDVLEVARVMSWMLAYLLQTKGRVFFFH